MASVPGARAPKYQQIAARLRLDTEEGIFEPGTQLPAETVLMERFRVTLPTLRQAIGLLRAEGLIETRHGIGTFIRRYDRQEHPLRHRHAEFSAPAVTARDVWVARPATAAEAEAHDLRPGTPVIHVTHTTFDEGGDIVGVAECVWPADRTAFVDEYRIGQ